MKIAIVCPGLLPIPAVKGGAVETLIQQFLDQNERNKEFDITVYSILDEIAVEKSVSYKNTKFVYYKKNNFIDKLLNIFSRGIKKIIKIDLNFNNSFIKKTMKNISQNNFKKIIIENNIDFIKPIYKATKGYGEIYLHLHNDYLNFKSNKSAKLADMCECIVTVSEYISNSVKTINGIDTKVKVLKNCTDLNIFNNKSDIDMRDKLKEKYNIKNEDTVILFSGRITPNKGVKELLLAFKGISELPNIKLLIVGSAWFGKNIKDDYFNEIKEISVEFKDKICFTGYIDYNKISEVYSIADISVVPSIWDDPAPLVVFESMASGLPLIVTNSGGIPEYVTEECAIIIERNSEIVENIKKQLLILINDKNKRLNMSKNAINNVKQYSVEKYFSDFTKILKN